MKKVLLVIDYTVDFVADEGALTCGKPGQEIEESIVSLTKKFLEENELVILPVDLHERNDLFHPEMKLFPPHNIRDTKGRELFGQLKNLYEDNKEKFIWLDKTRYSAFAGTNLQQLLSARKIEVVHLVGVCTDICILHTAVDAYNLGYEIVVHEDGVASFNPAGHEWALGHFSSSLGAKVIKNN